jgi:general secretion pathway protein K
VRRIGKKSPQKLARRGRRRGVALILVLSALTILTVMLTEVQDQSSADFGAALSARDAVIAEYAAKSAVNLSRLLIASEPTIRRAVSPLLMMAFRGGQPQIPVWEYASQVLGAFNDASGGESFSLLAGVDPKQGKHLGFAGAGFEIKIVDEDSKINLNLAAHGDPFSEKRLAEQLIGLIGSPQYSAMFENRDPDGQYSDRQTICSAIIDWADSDQDQAICDTTSQTAQQAAAEDSSYELLKRPYSRKNAAYDSLEELHRVRGISDDFWSTFIEPEPDKPEKRVVTVWGQGKINVNTANSQAIFALICASAPAARMCNDLVEAQKFLMAVTMLRGFMPGIPMFGSPDAFIAALQQQGPLGEVMKALQMEPIVVLSPSQTKDAITTDSKVFSIYATGYVKAGKRETRVGIHAVVDFRGVPTPEQATAQLISQLTQAAGGSRAPVPTPGTPASGAQSPDMSANSISGALRPSAGGNVIYYRTD